MVHTRNSDAPLTAWDEELERTRRKLLKQQREQQKDSSSTQETTEFDPMAQTAEELEQQRLENERLVREVR